MDTITEKQWEAWCKENEPTDTCCKVFADHKEVWGLLDEVWHKWILIEG